ncbi:MAG: hypothetical protein HKN26_04175 [Acidimicrobiales bacterium]|nr:hypothetical protein [Acidimicrobiales bacterium]
MDEYPVKVGSMLYTLVDPNKGHEIAYNRWYERDHYYAGCMIGPWLFAGSRWVATRELKDLRFPQDDSNLVTQPYDAGSYVAIYWVHKDHHNDHFKWAGGQVVELYKEGRGFAERKHAHTVLYWYHGTEYRDPDGVPVELALDACFDGHISVAIDRAAGVAEAQLDEFLAGALAETMAGSAIAMSSQWKPEQRGGETTSQAPMDLGSPTGGDSRIMQLMFTETDVRESWDRIVSYGQRVNDSGLATVVYAAPFHRTKVGTDTYVDEIW